MIHFDIIIPTYNNLAELQECLRGLEHQSLRGFRAIVCVDGSTDGTLEWLQATEFGFHLLVLTHPDGKNHGRNPTRNLALPHMNAEYLCFLDSDIIPSPDLLVRHKQQLDRCDCVSVGDVRYTNSDTNLWAAYAQTRGKNKFNHGDEIPYYYLATGNCAHRTQHFTTIGGQDPIITRYGGGDTEYALRLHSATGIPVYFNKEAYGTAEMNKDLPTALRQLEEFGETNLHYIHTKHPQETDIFGLRIFTGRTLAANILRLLLRLPLGMIESIAPILPLQLAIKFLNYSVLRRIYRGWLKGIANK
ncbi:MAG: glycosyltransferase family 2 protein, partial [Candidatus Kapabacteria bacterium]|nr:glycosyltransferase family 2 protein [Candidatus Kapabacteria bacterium]